MRTLLATAMMFFWTPLLAAEEPPELATHAKISTAMGDVIIELYPAEAPLTVANFLEYATSGHFDRSLFHRVVQGFVIQGGGYSRTFIERVTRPEIKYEGDNGIDNERGTIAMARTLKPDSASAQWFINLKDNEKLNHSVTDLGPIYGYAVFGRVVDGMDVVDAIGDVKTGPGGPFDSEVPAEPVFIIRVDPVEWPAADGAGGAMAE